MLNATSKSHDTTLKELETRLKQARQADRIPREGSEDGRRHRFQDIREPTNCRRCSMSAMSLRSPNQVAEQSKPAFTSLAGVAGRAPDHDNRDQTPRSCLSQPTSPAAFCGGHPPQRCQSTQRRHTCSASPGATARKLERLHFLGRGSLAADRRRRDRGILAALAFGQEAACAICTIL